MKILMLARKVKLLQIVNLCVTNREKDKFIFLNRKKYPYEGYWGMLGGKIEPEESAEKAASRELFEESGIRSNGEFLGKCHEKIIENDEVRSEFMIHFFVFIVDENVNFSSNGNEGEVKCIEKKDFEKYNLIPSDPLMIDAFLGGKTGECESVIEKIGEKYFQKEFIVKDQNF